MLEEYANEPLEGLLLIILYEKKIMAICSCESYKESKVFDACALTTQFDFSDVCAGFKLYSENRNYFNFYVNERHNR